MPSEQFVELVHEKWKNRLQATTVDGYALETYSEQVIGCIEMALRCVETNRHKRPSIGDIVEELNKMKTTTEQAISAWTPAQASSVPPTTSYTTQETTSIKGVSRLREHVQYTMRELVIGLAKSVVEGAQDMAQSAIRELNRSKLVAQNKAQSAAIQNVNRPKSVAQDESSSSSESAQSAMEEMSRLESMQRDLLFITTEFEITHSFLNEERINDSVVRQTRELAYDLEDCIDEALVSPSPDMAAAALVEAFRLRVEDANRRSSRYSFMSSSKSAGSTYDTRRHHILGDLTHLITNKDDADLQVVSVWGAGGGGIGIGTTSVIRKCYCDPEIIQSFICRAWVNLTHPFSPHEFVRSLMTHFYANSCQERKGAIIGVDVLTSMDASGTQGNLLSDFVQIIDKNRYLVVLEDLSTMAEWDSIRTFLPNRNNGSWIIVSSQKYEVASLCVGHPYQVFDLKQLPGEHSICAFLREDPGDKIKTNNISKSTGSSEVSTEYDLSHNQRNAYSSYHRSIHNSKMKAARGWMQNSSLVGCRLQMDQLHHCTVQAQMNHSQVMSVWGLPGVGKSALVRNLYCDRILENLQFQEYGWVGLSHSRPFNLRDFSRSLLIDFYSESLQSKETAPSSIVGINIKDAVRKCRELLSTHRCLVVIDGLQSVQEWDLIEYSLVSRHSKSRTVIIVITTEASVATYCTDKEELVFNVKTLEADAAYDLFENEVSKKTLLSASPSLSYRENPVLRDLISKCGGLPLIILAVAGILATKGFSWMDTAGSINLRFMHEVEINPEFDSLWDLFSWMHSCFRTCPGSIKPCIFYLSFFPRDHKVRRRRLVMRWIAEGYCRDSGDKSAQENGEEFISKLHNMGIIQNESSATTAFSDARMALNGFLRECILSRASDLVFELTTSSSSSSPTTQRSGRHLVISESWDRESILFESIDFSRLRSMTVFGMWKAFFVSKRTKLLRVLDLEDASGLTDGDVEQMVKLLPCLKYLSLRGCHGIFHLPHSIGDLGQLQTLDVINTSIVTLPISITELKRLQYIRGGAMNTIASEDPSAPHHLPRGGGVKVPGGIGELRALHTLGVVNIDGSGRKAGILKELKKLTQLRKLGVFGVNSNNSMAFSSAVSGHVHLGSLSVWLDKESRCCLDNISLSSGNLRSLKLYGLLDRVPVLLLDQLSKLAKLELEMFTLMEDDIRFLGGLPKLCILRLHVHQPQDGRLCFNACFSESYQQVKVLEIASRSRLHVIFGSKTMKNLDLLKIGCCSGSSYQLSGLDHLSELKEVWLKGSYEETLKHNLQNQLAVHPMKPVLKLEEERPRH